MKTDTRFPSLPIGTILCRSHSTSFSTRASSLRLSILVLMVLLAGLTGFDSQAKTRYPKAENPYVNDFAQILTAEETSTIRTVLAKLRADDGIEAVVVIIRSIHSYKTGDQNIESFATNLFNNWGIGDRQMNNGVLILVAVKDRKIRIELGSGYGSQLNTQMQGVIREQMLPHFRDKNYYLGILDGTNAVVRTLSKPAPATAPPMITMPDTTGNLTSSNSDSNDEFLLFVIAGIMVAALFGLIWYTRYRHRRCPYCRANMVRLDEGSEDQYLDDGKKLEKSLGSVNYRVWQCPSCDHHTLQADSHWFSSFSICHACGYRTCEVIESIITHPTYVTPGEKQITKNCQYCGTLHQETILLPMLPPPTHYDHSRSSNFASQDSGGSSSYSSGFDSSSSSSSSSSSGGDSGGSSSSSFSGGSSSGDGASGNW